MKQLFVLLVLAAAAPLSAQSLADVAKKTAEQRERAKTAAAATPETKPAAKVYTNADLPDVPPPAAATPAQDATPVVAPASTSTPAATDPGHPTDAQLKELKLTDMRVSLKKAQDTLRDGEKAFKDFKALYSNTCSHGGHSTWELMDACSKMNAEIEITWPRRLQQSRDSIRDLEAAIATASR